MTERTGVQSSMNEEDVRRYSYDVLEEIKRKAK